MSAPAHFVDGAPLVVDGEDTVEVRSPFTGELLGRVPIGREGAVSLAVEAAQRAFTGPWRDLPLNDRVGLLGDLRERVTAGRDELADLLVAEVGKPIRAARVEVANLIDSMEYFLVQSHRLIGAGGTRHQSDPVLRIVRDPVGVVAAITPFNFPVQLLGWKVVPALLAGCTVVAKPDPRTPLSTALLARWAAEVDLPEGVLGVVHGDARTGSDLVSRPEVRKVAFTGSVDAGRAVYRLAAEGIKRVTLELGGCSALVVAADADLEGHLEQVLDRSLYNSGQYCFRINRALVQSERYEEFLERYAGAAARRVVGDPRDEATDLGPLIDRAAFERALGTIAAAEAAGARIVLDGRAHCREGISLLGPTLIADVPPDAAPMRSETFGPVVVAAPFDALDEGIALANGTDYGLAAFALARDPATVERLARELEAGTVWVNALGHTSLDAPFGGVKQSGIGVEKSRWAFDEYLQPRAVYVEGGAQP